VATSGDRLGDAIVDALKSNGFYPGSASPSQESRSRAEWKVIAATILAELKNNQDIVLQAGDIPVDPGTFQDSTHQPITGVGVSEATTLSGRTQ